MRGIGAEIGRRHRHGHRAREREREREPYRQTLEERPTSRSPLVSLGALFTCAVRTICLRATRHHCATNTPPPHPPTARPRIKKFFHLPLLFFESASDLASATNDEAQQAKFAWCQQHNRSPASDAFYHLLCFRCVHLASRLSKLIIISD